MFEHLPGGELLTAGLRDLQAGQRSVNALLILVGRPRLERGGVTLPPNAPTSLRPEHELYDLLVDELGREQAYSRYNSLMRRLVSLENALDTLPATPRSGAGRSP